MLVFLMLAMTCMIFLEGFFCVAAVNLVSMAAVGDIIFPVAIA